MSLPKSVPVHVALVWTCPACGELREHRGADLEAGTAEQIAESGRDPEEYAVAPEFVYCGPCDRRYEVEEAPDDA